MIIVNIYISFFMTPNGVKQHLTKILYRNANDANWCNENKKHDY